MVDCYRCKGTGLDATSRSCEVCGGTGKITREQAEVQAAAEKGYRDALEGEKQKSDQSSEVSGT